MLSCKKFSKISGTIALMAVLSACGGGGSDDGTIADNTGGGGGTPTPTNRAPTISGTPPSKVVAGEGFSFTPSASDPDGDNLSFTIQNRPTWVNSFNANTGAMSGTPGAGDIGTYQQISITVSDGSLNASLSPFAVEVEQSTQPPSNQAPSIGGNPASTVSVGNSYTFTPSASDPDGDNLSFSVQNLPSWMSFNSNNGRVTGTPSAGDVGTYNNIRITVSDGSANDNMSFSITVEQISSGNITLEWEAPTQNTDGSPLNDLAGYAFYYGSSSGSYPNRLQVNDPSLTRLVVENLSPGTYYFVGVAITSNSVESEYSNEATKVVQ
ncbi:MAG: putative Ig domain-containing protein [Woeseiaceae bacterium]